MARRPRSWSLRQLELYRYDENDMGDVSAIPVGGGANEFYGDLKRNNIFLVCLHATIHCVLFTAVDLQYVVSHAGTS